ADFGNIQVLDPRSSDLRIAVHYGFPSPWADFWTTPSKGQAPCAPAPERLDRAIVEDIPETAIFPATEALKVQLDAGVRAVQSTPLYARSGAPVGMISTHYRTPRRPTERALRFLDVLAREAADALERAQVDGALRRAVAKARGILETAADAI